MSHHDRDAEIAAFIRTKGVTRCPTACVVPTQGSPDPADQAALEQYEIARDQLRRMKLAARGHRFKPLPSCYLVKCDHPSVAEGAPSQIRASRSGDFFFAEKDSASP